MGKKTDRIYELESELARVKGTNLMLEAWRKSWLASFANEDTRISMQTVMGALHQLWDLIGGTDQTSSVQRMHTLKEQARKGMSLVNIQRVHNQTEASLRHQLTVLEAANRNLIFQRDSAQAGSEDHGWTVVAKDRRIEELESALDEAIVAIQDHSLIIHLSQVLGRDGNAKV